MPSLIIHGHFYQPPRENPFLDVVEAETSAAPFHDWNQRIERECYRAVAAARLTSASGRIRAIVNALESISFNFGPTLLEWMEHEAKDTYQAILAADRESAARLGHGNAIAQPYHHTILPLASRRDKTTEVRWGIADFRRRFGRDPEGMWLPETALDDETLDVLAEAGIRFTIAAPRQVKERPPNGRPGLYRTHHGRAIALCVYDGDLSHRIAFGGALHDAMGWAAHMNAQAGTLGPNGLLSAATDGETYGHHHRFGEMALARALEEMRHQGWHVENFASYLARVPATIEVSLVEPSSWSCVHGVERWRANCGCRTDPGRNWTQAWRAPLRTALERLAAGLHAIYEAEGGALIADPWSARDAYGAVVASGPAALRDFARRVTNAPDDPACVARARELLEMERDALRMFTSCAWFFDDIAGLESRQVLRYAARAISLAGGESERLEARFLQDLRAAESNESTEGNGAHVYLRHARPRIPAPIRIAAAAVAAAHIDSTHRDRYTSAEIDLAGNRVSVAERRTGRRHDFTVRVSRPASTDVAVELTGVDGHSWRLTLEDLPERPRHAIHGLLLRTLLPRCLTPDELDELLTGGATLRGLIRVALIRAIEKLATDESAPAEQLVHDLLDLFIPLEANVPFDAQNAFWRIWQSLPGARRERLAAIGERLGFFMQDLSHTSIT
ncbi:MAG TPA: DUF3536 domain-containing protein [Gemmatimonadaceae bacterium]|nr:DUF3536 domain-containing protein [Gemmatimonadaceae bacterium]